MQKTLSLRGDAASRAADHRRARQLVRSSATPTAAPSSPKPEPTRTCGPGLHLRVRAGQGRVGQHAPRRFPPDPRRTPILPPRDGFVPDRDKFHASFADDLPADLAAFMADSQVPWGVDALGGPVTDPAWRGKPSWYMVTTEDRMIPPAAQRTMSQRTGSTVVEVAASHSVYVSQPAAVVSLIKKAASAVAAQQ